MEHIEYQAMHEQEQHLWWYRALHLIMINRLQRLFLSHDASLLDAGCGTGGLLRKIRSGLPGLQLTGLEFHPEGMKYAKAVSGINLVNGSVNTMPFANNCFDVITLTDVLYHKNINPHACLSECLRILKPGGSLLINVSAYNWMTSAHDRQVHTRERYTANRLREQLTQTGFLVKHTGYWNSLLFPLMVIHRLTAGKLKNSSDVERVPAWQNNLFFRIIHIEQFLQQHHIHLPFGGSVWALATKQ